MIPLLPRQNRRSSIVFQYIPWSNAKIKWLFLSPLFLGCSSPLEEIEVHDFDLIRATFNVIKEISSEGVVTDLIELQISDKNYKGFELKNGSITVNGQPMTYKNKPLINAYYSNLEISPNTQYEFVVTLANGDSAKSTITTPEMPIRSITFAESITLGEDYFITWDKTPQSVHASFHLDDNSFGENPSYTLQKELTPDTGELVVNGSATKNYPHATRSYFKLVFSGTSQLSTQFRSAFATVACQYTSKRIQVIP